MSLKFEKENRRKVKGKVKKVIEKKENEIMQPKKSTALSLKKENFIVDIFCLFFCFFFKDVVKFKNKLRTIIIESRFWKNKIETIQPHFEKHGPYKKILYIRIPYRLFLSTVCTTCIVWYTAGHWPFHCIYL